MYSYADMLVCARYTNKRNRPGMNMHAMINSVSYFSPLPFILFFIFPEKFNEENDMLKYLNVRIVECFVHIKFRYKSKYISLMTIQKFNFHGRNTTCACVGGLVYALIQTSSLQHPLIHAAW